MAQSQSDSVPSKRFWGFLYNYWDIVGGFLLASLAFVSHVGQNPYLCTLFAALSIGFLSVTVSEIAEILAERLKEPYGSFVITFSAVIVEILLLFMILVESIQTPSALETVKSGIISAVIVDMNVLLGLAVFIGGLAFKEQEHNEDTSRTYTTVLLVSALALLVPSILTYAGRQEAGSLQYASVIIAALLLLFYLIIFIFQTKTHSHFFKATARSRIFRYRRRLKQKEGEEGHEETGYLFEKLPNIFNLFITFVLIFIIGFVAEIFADDSLEVFADFGISTGLAGLIIAVISVAPEIFTAIKAAKNDQIQRVVNIAMGASTASILLTVPILMGLSLLYGIKLTLDFNSLQIGALILTIILAWKTTDDGETNYFEGISHLMFFVCFAVMAAFY